LHYAKEATDLAYAIDHKEGLRESLMVLGVGFSQLKEYKSGLEVFDRVCLLNQQKERTDLIAEIEVANQMGDIYRNLEQYGKSLIKHQEALELAMELPAEKEEQISPTLFYLGKL